MVVGVGELRVHHGGARKEASRGTESGPEASHVNIIGR